MQIKSQNSKAQEWRVAAAAGTLGALGIGGLAVAGPGLWTYTTDRINLQDQVELAAVTESTAVIESTAGTGFIYPAVMFSMSADTTWDSPDDTPVSNSISVASDPRDPESISVSPDPLESDSISLSPDPLESDSISLSPDPLESDSISLSPDPLESDSISLSSDSLDSP